MQLLKRLLIISVLFTVSQFLFSQSIDVLDDGVLEVVEDDYDEVSSEYRQYDENEEYFNAYSLNNTEETEESVENTDTTEILAHNDKEETKEVIKAEKIKPTAKTAKKTPSKSNTVNTSNDKKIEDTKTEEKTYPQLPRGYRGITLGMNLETTKSTLLKHPEFGYHGERDVSLLPGENRVLISTDADSGHGSPFLCESYFQFYEDFLYVITVNINRDKMDYYSMFKKLSDKYGPPTDLNPQMSKWENETTIVYLEKPLLLKYIDKAVFDKTLSKSSIDQGPTEFTRDLFLDEL